MQKVLYSLFFLCFSNLIGFAQSDKCDTIYWNEKAKLNWSYFKAQPDSSSSFKAVTVAGIGYKAQNIGDTLAIDIYFGFYTCKSWTKSSSEDLLKHEQTHFDIAEYFKRLFIRKILATHFSRQNWTTQIETIYQEIKKTRKELDDKYDLATNFSRNKTMQEKWSLDMLSRLNKLKSNNEKRIILILID